MAGHSNDNAVYVFGYYKDNFLSLDPHKINDGTPIKMSTLDKFQATECLKLSSRPHTNLSSAAGCGFYLSSLHDFLMWKNQLLNMQRDFGKSHLIFSIFLQTPIMDEIMVSSESSDEEAGDSFDECHSGFAHLEII